MLFLGFGVVFLFSSLASGLSAGWLRGCLASWLLDFELLGFLAPLAFSASWPLSLVFCGFWLSSVSGFLCLLPREFPWAFYLKWSSVPKAWDAHPKKSSPLMGLITGGTRISIKVKDC